jgi:uncharacterized membrane protein
MHDTIREGDSLEKEDRDGSGRQFGHLIGRLRGYMVAGILVTAPVGITLYLAWLFLSFVDAQVTPLFPVQYNPNTYLPFGVPGVGLIILIVALTIIGWLTKGIVGRYVLRQGENLLHRTPVIRSIYGATKQIVETVVSRKSEAFRQVVLFEYPRRGCWAMGFVTGKTVGEVQNITEDEIVNVFLPTTPNPTSGFLLFEPKDKVVLLGMTVEEAFKMVVSGGIVTPPDRTIPAADGTTSAQEPRPAATVDAD